MSRNYNKDGVFVDTGFLRDHVSKLRDERKIALRLHDYVSAMKHLDDPTRASKYNPALREIDQMTEYLGKMATQLSQIEEDATRLSRELGNTIVEDSEYAHYVVSKTITL